VVAVFVASAQDSSIEAGPGLLTEAWVGLTAVEEVRRVGFRVFPGSGGPVKGDMASLDCVGLHGAEDLLFRLDLISHILKELRLVSGPVLSAEGLAVGVPYHFHTLFV